MHYDWEKKFLNVQFQQNINIIQQRHKVMPSPILTNAVWKEKTVYE